MLVIIGILLGLLICRVQRRPKPRRNRPSHDDVDDIHVMQETGRGLPVDIPIQALARIPPPRYTSVDDLSRTTASMTGSAAEAASSVASFLPPPYYASGPRHGAVVGGQYFDSTFEAPPQYRSQMNVSGGDVESPAIHAPAGGVVMRPLSIGSFMEFPSMSDILLTSSRSSIPATLSSPSATSGGRATSGFASRSGGAFGGGASTDDSERMHVGASDSAAGDSVDSRRSSSSAAGGGNLSRRHRETSASMSDVQCGVVDIPDGGLQKARRAAAAASSGARRHRDRCASSGGGTGSEMSVRVCADVGGALATITNNARMDGGTASFGRCRPDEEAHSSHRIYQKNSSRRRQSRQNDDDEEPLPAYATVGSAGGAERGDAEQTTRRHHRHHRHHGPHMKQISQSLPQLREETEGRVVRIVRVDSEDC